MTTTPPENLYPEPEPKRYFWMALGALCLALLTVVLIFISAGLQQGAGMISSLLIIFMMIVFFVGLVLAIISLIRMRHKVLPIIALLALGIPFFGFLCCGGGLLTAFYGVDFLQGNNPIFAPKPKVEWDTSPGTIVAQAAHPIKHSLVSIPPEYTRNYIPEARLWGDGRIVWATYYSSDGPRSVMEGRLTSEQMTAFFKQAIDVGFFGWNDNYFPLIPYENPPTDYLTINIRTAKKTVSNGMDTAPTAYKSLLNTLTNGPFAESKAFMPTHGTLIAIPTQNQAAINWDKENLNLDLSKAAQGIPVEGKVLQVAWEAVNKNPYYPPPVSQNRVSYILYVIIPELMY